MIKRVMIILETFVEKKNIVGGCSYNLVIHSYPKYNNLKSVKHENIYLPFCLSGDISQHTCVISSKIQYDPENVAYIVSVNSSPTQDSIDCS